MDQLVVDRKTHRSSEHDEALAQCPGGDVNMEVLGKGWP